MSTRDRTGEIAEVKERNPYGERFGSFSLNDLKSQWLRTRTDHSVTPDFYVIKAVTLLEVFTRTNIAELVDHGVEYANRAIEFAKNLKLDFALVQSIQGRVVTLGDVVAHSVSVNSFGQMLGYFEILLDKKPLRPVLTSAVDRWATRIEQRPAEPIISDFDSLARHLSTLFEIRHILCHEIPKKPVYSVNDIDDFLSESIRFTKALEEVLTFERFGLVPLTQTEMNVAAGEHRRKKETELDELLSEIREIVKPTAAASSPSIRGSDARSWRDCLDEAQEKWLAYRNAHCDFDAYLSRGGTIYPTLWAGEASRLTEVRVAELRAWLKRESET
jgi:uncharacterized protein YecT (DUF1311 family)